MRTRLFIIIAITTSSQGLAQPVTAPIEIEEHIGNIFLEKGEEADNQPYFELLMQFYNNPIAINVCKFAELNALQLLTKKQIEAIFLYRDTYGHMQNKYELLAISSLSVEIIKKISPFITFSKPISIGTALKKSVIAKSKYLLVSGSTTIERVKGFTSNSFLGDPYQYNFRMKLSNPGHSSLGITMQKDPGELLFRDDSLYSGPDFYSFHYYLQNIGKVKQVAIGDYKLQFGQGLLLGAGFLVGKNASSITSIQSTLKVQPYTSLTEYNFFRGIGATITPTPNWEVSLFYSNKKKDASVFTEDSTINRFTSFRTDGLHRTQSEIEAKNTVGEQVAGIAITYANRSAEIGIIGLYNSFDISFKPKPTLANVYKFQGRENYNLSVFGRYNYRNITFYGEAAHTVNNGSALNIGLVSSLSKNMDFTFQYRYLAPDFHSFYGVSFAESSTLSNERGAYWGINLKILPALTIMGYFDFYKFPWLKSTVPQPSTGNDGLFRITYKLRKSAVFYTQLQSEQKDRKLQDGAIQQAEVHRLLKYILNLDYNLKNPVSFRTRIQWTKSYFESDEVGVLIYQDVNLSMRNLTLTTRYSIFDTNGFLSRQYMYEKDLLYAFSTPQFSGKGIRYYAVLKYSLLKGLVLRAKWAQTIYYDRYSIGNGNSKIEGNKKSQLSLQLKYDF